MGRGEVKTFHYTNQAKKMEVGGVFLPRDLVTHKVAETCVKLSREQFHGIQDASLYYEVEECHTEYSTAKRFGQNRQNGMEVEQICSRLPMKLFKDILLKFLTELTRLEISCMGSDNLSGSDPTCFDHWSCPDWKLELSFGFSQKERLTT